MRTPRHLLRIFRRHVDDSDGRLNGASNGSCYSKSSENYPLAVVGMQAATRSMCSEDLPERLRVLPR